MEPVGGTAIEPIRRIVPLCKEVIEPLKKQNRFAMARRHDLRNGLPGLLAARHCAGVR